ncbi:Phosphoglycolate phosphatase, HAD superfamily [Actinokineospora terrae]|uniref:Phosphoglycolate phosphatase, HAD superfamily n=1 Tax=Actinokineospora terrae TaxID=155974 RepID=A0A1H9L5B4_9PSEU|nr:Phosphoglycolate phosphatase, HAD superfamily [Actinokineospora terrae]
MAEGAGVDARGVVWGARAVVFDLDDTLLLTRVVKWAHHQAVAARFYGIDLTEDVLREHWGKPYDELITALYRGSASLADMKAANLSLEHLYRKSAAAGACELVTALLDHGTHVGVVTSANTDPTRADLDFSGFPVDRLAFVHGADLTASHKPDPAVFDDAKRVLGAHGVTSADTVYVGDAPMDRVAAEGAGFGFVGVGSALGALWVADLSELR